MRINKLSVIDSKKVFENKQIFGMSFCLQRINKLIELNSFHKKTPLAFKGQPRSRLNTQSYICWNSEHKNHNYVH